MSNYSCGQRRGAEIEPRSGDSQHWPVRTGSDGLGQLGAADSIRRVDLPSVSLHSVLCWRWWETHATWSHEHLRKTSKR